jgi:hypothetical protein
MSITAYIKNKNSGLRCPSSQQHCTQNGILLDHMYLIGKDDIESVGAPPAEVTPSPNAPRSVFAGKSARFWVCFSMLNLTAFVSSLDAVVVAAVLPTITADLGGTSDQAFWSGSGFLLAATITQPVFGTFSEIFGRKIMLLLALACFLMGSILCSLSFNMNAFVVSRVVLRFKLPQ